MKGIEGCIQLLLSSPYALGAAILLILLSIIYFLTRRNGPANQPPEAKGWPILGFVPYLYPRVFKGFMTLKSQHPDVARVKIGVDTFIILLSYQAFREALTTKGENFSGRVFSRLRDRVVKKSGILNIDGPVWREHRRFALRVLRDFGFGRNVSETIVHNETQTLLSQIELKRKDSSGVNTLDLLLRAVSNVICTLTMGEQPGYEDDLFTESVSRIRENLNVSPFKNIFTMFPMLQFEFVADILPFSKRMFKNVTFLQNYLLTKIQKHQDRFDPAQEPIDYIDAFLLEQYKLNQRNGDKTNPTHTYTAFQLQREILEIFTAGTDTTSNSLSWALFMLCLNKDVQKRCYEEIEAAIGPEREPAMKDKQNTPYILAVIDEVQRYTTLVPMSLIHRNFEEDTIMGYTIPANSKIIPFIYGIHHDPNVWEKPEEFYPQHFLAEDGKTYKTREQLMPFSMGKRICLGEALARVELYIFFVSILQRYSVSLHPEDEKRVDEILLGTEGLIHSPADHRIVFTPRN